MHENAQEQLGPRLSPPACFLAEDLAMKGPEKNSQSLGVSTKYILSVNAIDNLSQNKLNLFCKYQVDLILKKQKKK